MPDGGGDKIILDSATLMLKLRKEAGNDTTGKRLATLDRLETACHAILSGEAFQLARKHHFPTQRFKPSRRRFVAEDVHEYVKLRRVIDGSRGKWDGPTATFLRADKGLKEYIEAFETENFGDRKTAGSSKKKALDKIIDEIPSLTDRLEVRNVIEHGRRAQAQLTKARMVVKKVARIDLDQIDPELSVEEILSQSAGKLGPIQQAIISKLVRRLINPHLLGEMGLIYRGGRVKMGFSPGTELVAPDELALLAQISDIELPD
jgi:hypothetical protein